MSKMHSELWEQLRMSLLIESGSGVPEEVMFPVQPKEGLDEPSKSIGWGTDRRIVLERKLCEQWKKPW